MTAPRLWVVSYLVQPQFMVDDGETLTPLAVQPISVPAANWPDALALTAEAVNALRAEIEVEPIPPNRATRRSKVTADNASPVLP